MTLLFPFLFYDCAIVVYFYPGFGVEKSSSVAPLLFSFLFVVFGVDSCCGRTQQRAARVKLALIDYFCVVVALRCTNGRRILYGIDKSVSEFVMRV